MNQTKERKYREQKRYSLVWAGFLTALGCIVSTTVQAEIETTVLFQPPPESAQPESTESAASRQSGQCFQDLLQSDSSKLADLIPIVPQSKIALTVSDRPKFWFYLPETSAQQVILAIKREGIEPHWQQTINLTGETGIVGVPLSDEAPALEIGQSYQWALIMVCGDRPSPNDPVVVSWIKRIDQSEVNQDLQTSTELEKAASYAQQGIWYDALDILAAKAASIDDWQEIWVQYLESGGLGEVANEPVIIDSQ